jgi:hypothetical protein
VCVFAELPALSAKADELRTSRQRLIHGSLPKWPSYLQVPHTRTLAYSTQSSVRVQSVTTYLPFW